MKVFKNLCEESCNILRDIKEVMSKRIDNSFFNGKVFFIYIFLFRNVYTSTVKLNFRDSGYH